MRPRALLVGLALLASFTAAEAQRGGRIPEHPSQLRFEPLDWQVPDAAPLRRELPGGIVAYIVPDSSLPLVEIAVAVRAGETFDPVDRPGLAALTAAMLRRGGAGERDADALDQAIDELGATLDTGAGLTRAGASLSCPSWVLDDGLELLFEVLRRPRFEAGRLERAKANLLSSMAARGDSARDVLDREWSWLMYGERHPASRQLVAADLGALDRASMAAFHQSYWHPGNFVIAVSGAVDPDRIADRLAAHLANWPVGEPASPWPPEPDSKTASPGRYHVEKDTPQTQIAVGHLAAVRSGWDDPDTAPLLVMSEVLAIRVIGRLRAARGLVYSANTSFGVGDYWPPLFAVVLASAGSAAPEAIEIVRQEIAALHRSPPVGAELVLAKRALLDPFPLAFDTAEEIAGYFAEDEYLGRPHSFWNAHRARVEAVGATDVRRVARAHVRPDELLVLTVGRLGEQPSGDRGAVRSLPVRDPLTLEP